MNTHVWNKGKIGTGAFGETCLFAAGGKAFLFHFA